MTTTEQKPVITFKNVLFGGYLMCDGCIYSKSPKTGDWMRLENELMEELYKELKFVNVIHRPESILLWQQFIRKNAKFGYEIDSVIHNPCDELLEIIKNAKTSGKSAE